ncbi:MAG: spermidine synthase [Bryobacteraceae bacterium]
MSSFAADAAIDPTRAFTRGRALPLLFGVTIFVSACLLFLVQPLISKLILPWFGGSAAVWVTCMLFFQAGLLLGYSYAHELSRRVPPKLQALVHVILLTGSLAMLPILPNSAWQPAPGEDPTWRLLGVLAATVGLPYLLLSSTSPLLQTWFAQSEEGQLPYRYFALSNAGSLAALISYPILIEPRMTGHSQAVMWSGAFALFVCVCAGTAVLSTRSRTESPQWRLAGRGKTVPGNKPKFILPLCLAACASALLLSATNLLTQNIAPMPLVWVLPLSVYLLTFILCFESARWYVRPIFLPLVLPALMASVALDGPLENSSITESVPTLLAALFVCCMACHGEVARLRPDPAYLTGFYLCISSGGVIGGMFVGLVAPHLFPSTYENPISFLFCAGLLLYILWKDGRRDWDRSRYAFVPWLAALCASVLLLVYVADRAWREYKSAVLLARNFYGALRVEDYKDHGRTIRELSHGTIIHGLQMLSPHLRHFPTTYYARESGIGLTWQSLQKSGPLAMGVVGLGAGTLATYGRGGDRLHFYEINPLMRSIAQTRFSYLSDTPSHVDIALGDARITMSREAPQKFDVLVVDAFSGDAIPVHLLTREAFALYWRHLKPNGVLAVHISNRYLHLAPVVELAAQRSGKSAWLVENGDRDLSEIYAASYVLVTSREGFSDEPLLKHKLQRIHVPPHLREWTDDYSNLWDILDTKTGR